MFRPHQIIGASKFVRKFASVARELEYEPQAILIIRENGKHLVLVNAEIFDGLAMANRPVMEEAMDVLQK